MSKKFTLRLIFRLLAIIAMQQHQLLIYKRHIKRPGLRVQDRLFWILCRGLFKQFWKQVLTVVRPETVIRWHRELSRLRWRWICKIRVRSKPRVPQEVIELVRHMAAKNLRWDAETSGRTVEDWNPPR